MGGIHTGKKDPLHNVPPHARPEEETLLGQWMKATQTTFRTLSKALDASERIVIYWSRGQAMPSLIHAFRIDAVTKGKVPPSSWLGTSIGRARWNSRSTDE